MKKNDKLDQEIQDIIDSLEALKTCNSPKMFDYDRVTCLGGVRDELETVVEGYENNMPQPEYGVKAENWRTKNEVYEK